jgi:hypothetical protein
MPKMKQFEELELAMKSQYQELSSDLKDKAPLNKFVSS